MITQNTGNEFDKLAPLEKWLENRMVAEYAVNKEKKEKERDEFRKDSVFMQTGLNRENPETQEPEAVSHPQPVKDKPEN